MCLGSVGRNLACGSVKEGMIWNYLESKDVKIMNYLSERYFKKFSKTPPLETFHLYSGSIILFSNYKEHPLSDEMTRLYQKI